MNCLMCNKEIVTEGAKKYCSLKCRDKSYQIIKTFTCEQCGKQVSGTAKQLRNNRRFCSQECVLAWKRVAYKGRIYKKYVKIHCDECGKEFERMPSKINKKNFCNKSCRGLYGWKNTLKGKPTLKSCFAMTSKGIVKFRSRWEAVFVIDFLDKNNLQWLYEPETFKLIDGRSYTPDFYLPDTNEWIEIKGSYNVQKNYNKAFIFQKTFPDKKIMFIDEDMMKNKYNFDLSHKHLCSIVIKPEACDLAK
jgi:hypothetical protein